jgi:hypothetical protein
MPLSLKLMEDELKVVRRSLERFFYKYALDFEG